MLGARPGNPAGSRFRKRRELLLDLAQCAAEAVTEYMKRQVGADARPGIVVSIASAGDLLPWHPHGHLLVTDGARSRTMAPFARSRPGTLTRS